MKLFPQKNYSIKRLITKESAIKTLKAVTVQPEDKLITKIIPRNKCFRGEVYGYRFELEPIKPSHWSVFRHLRSMIKGEVCENEHTTIIKWETHTNFEAKLLIVAITFIFPILILITGEEWYIFVAVSAASVLNLGWMHLVFGWFSERIYRYIDELFDNDFDL